MKQTQFWKNSPKKHGGGFAAGKRKIARPITTKSPMHVALRSSRARGKWNFLLHKRAIEEQVRALAKRHHVRIHHIANVGNHIHLTLQASARREFQNFLRVLPQAIAFLVTKARKGNPIGRFWDNLVFTRIISWGRDWSQMFNYLEKNRLEVAGESRDRINFIYKELWESG